MIDGQEMSLGTRLLRERESHHWTQEELVEKIGSSPSSINRWEHGRAIPRQDMINRLSEVFGRPPERWGTGRKVLWNVPYLRNPYFTGRDQIFLRLHRVLAAENTVVLSQTRAISGLGGIGKTQTALEYAYRYANEYEAVLWVRADSHEALSTDFALLATTLDLREKAEMDQFRVIAGVRRWLQDHSPWLLIFDNADDLAVVTDFLPKQARGAILLTTHSQITGPHIIKVELGKMSQEEGVTFLLRRIASGEDEEGEADLAKRASDVERQAAKKLWSLMDGLPLALDQAGAYIEAGQSSLADYLDLYRHHREELLRDRGGLIPEHPDAVATTWSLSFQRVEEKNPGAAELLRLCAFLSPDAIPEEIITRGAAHFTSSIQALAASARLLHDAVATLRSYSLVGRDAAAHTLSIHRLVQDVLQDAMPVEARREWKERIVRAVHETFPEAPFKEWARCGRLLPHVLVCASWLEDEPIAIQEASSLFDKAGSYLRERGQYAEAEPLLLRALSIREQHPDAEELDIVTSLSSLAGLYSYQGKYKLAEPLVKRALSIRERNLGVEHPDTAKSLNNLAILYMLQGKYDEAERLYQQALSINEQHLGEHPETAKSLNNLAVLYEQQKKYEQAEPLYERAIPIAEQHLGAEHFETARYVGNLALLYMQQGKYEQAEPLYHRSISIHEQSSGAESPETAYPLYGLAELYRHQEKYEEAEPLFQRVLSIREQHLEAEHPDTLEALRGLADLYREQGRHEEAEGLYQRVRAIQEQAEEKN